MISPNPPPAIVGRTLTIVNHWNISEECSRKNADDMKALESQTGTWGAFQKREFILISRYFSLASKQNN